MGPPEYGLSARDRGMAIVAKLIIHSGFMNRVAIFTRVKMEWFVKCAAGNKRAYNLKSGAVNAGV